MKENGIMYWNDGDRYEGDWRNDKKEGKGILYFNIFTQKNFYIYSIK